MGCDIHMMVETRGEAGRWSKVVPTPGVVVYDDDAGCATYADPSGRVFIGHYSKAWTLAKANGDPRDRYYSLFSLLSGVRSRAGHWPARFGRGLPADADLPPPDEVGFYRNDPNRGLNIRCHDDPRSVDSHTPDHATLAELVALGIEVASAETKGASADPRLDQVEGCGFLRWVRALARHYDPDHTRVIWWFDN
jgi:hypothetical protein